MQPGNHVLIPAQCFADPGQFISQLLVGTPELQAERRSPLRVVGGHAGGVPFIPAPPCLAHSATGTRRCIHSTMAQRDPESSAWQWRAGQLAQAIHVLQAREIPG